MSPTESRITQLADEATARGEVYHRILAHYSDDDGLTISRSTHHDVRGGAPWVLRAVSDRLTLGAAVIEIRQVKIRRQAEKASV